MIIDNFKYASKKTFNFFSKNTLRYILKIISILLALPSIIILPIIIEGLLTKDSENFSFKTLFIKAIFLAIIIEIVNRYFCKYVEKKPMRLYGILYGIYYAKIFIVIAISTFIMRDSMNHIAWWFVAISLSYIVSGMCRAYSKKM